MNPLMHLRARKDDLISYTPTFTRSSSTKIGGKQRFKARFSIAQRSDGDLNPHEILASMKATAPLTIPASFLAEIRVAGAPSMEIQVASVEDEVEDPGCAARRAGRHTVFDGSGRSRASMRWRRLGEETGMVGMRGGAFGVGDEEGLAPDAGLN